MKQSKQEEAKGGNWDPKKQVRSSQSRERRDGKEHVMEM